MDTTFGSWLMDTTIVLVYNASRRSLKSVLSQGQGHPFIYPSIHYILPRLLHGAWSLFQVYTLDTFITGLTYRDEQPYTLTSTLMGEVQLHLL